MADSDLESLGPRVTTSRFEREFYSSDLAYVPEPLLKVLADPLPDSVIRPLDAEEVSKAVAHAARNGTPVTPRGGGSTAYGNAVPAKSGILLDMTSFRGWSEVDRERMAVWVLPGTTWFELEEALGRAGYAACSYPSSARAATVGGWFSMGGLGIGSLRYGPLAGLVGSIEVVLPDGAIRRLDRSTSPPLDWFAGAEGTLGVVTGLELRVRERPEAEEHVLAECADLAQAVELTQAMADRFPRLLFNAHVNAASYNRLLARLGYPGHPERRPTVSFDFDGKVGELAGCREEAARAAERCGATLLDRKAAAEEWESRFRSLRIKREIPALLGAEVILPLEALLRYVERCEALASGQGTEIPTYGHVVARDRVLAMSLVPSDERSAVRYVLDASLLHRIYDLAANEGGVPYAVGLWNTPYLRRVYGRADLRERRERKRLLDPKGIMNPGKTWEAPFLLTPWLFGPGMHALSTIRRAVGKGESRR